MKRLLITTAQVFVTVGILWWVFHDPAKRADMASALARAAPLWFLASFAIYTIVEVLGALRWHLLLRVQGIYLSWMRVLMLFMIGAFFNLFMLGATGGDVVKIYYLLKETPEKKAVAFLTVVMDRLIGLLALILMALVLVGWRYQEYLRTPTTQGLLLTLTFILASALFGIAVSFAVTGFGLVDKLPKRLPMREKLIELAAAYNVYGRAWKTSLACLLLSAGAHAAYFMTFYYAARAFTDRISIMDMFAVMPIVNTITALPISLSGVGVREGLFEQLLFNLYGVGKDVAVLISLTGFLIIILWSALGGLIYLAYRPSRPVAVGEMTREVSELENRISHGDQP